MDLTLEHVREAQARIAQYVVRTPLLPCQPRAGVTLWVKPENLQPIGAFKIRGAFNLMLQLPKDVPGVVAHSSGNHAQAVARAARVLGIRAVVVMPSNAPALKRLRTEADGAEVVTVGNDSDERARVASEIAKERGYVPVPPYDHPMIIAGQGTAALEVATDNPSLERFYCPVSGGGLIAGTALALKTGLCPNLELIGVEPMDGNDTALSLANGARTRIEPPQTIADGLRVRIPGEITWPITQKYISKVELVTDEEMLGAMSYAWRELRLVLEPSGATALAAALRDGRGNAGVMLSGGNVETDVFKAVVSR